MFTGIIEEIGHVNNVKKGTASAILTIQAEKVLEGTHIGDSIAVNGVCCFAGTPCAIVPVGAIVSLHLKAMNLISNVVISAPALIPIAYPAPVLNGGYHILCLENPGLLGL